MASDFFRSQYGNYADLPFWRKREYGRLTDLPYNARLAANSAYRRLPLHAASLPVQRVLLAGVEVPARRADLARAMQTISQSRHDVTICKAELHQGKGKFQNINLALQSLDLDAFDWLLVIDDDIAVPAHFLENFLYLADRAQLKICQPAHRFHSYQSYALTQRRWNTLVRSTHYVECGPVTAFHRDILPFVFPFPELRWAWGNDLAWSEYGKRHHFRLGIVDATPIGHLRPVAASYKSQDARQEGELFLETEGVTITRREALQNEIIYTTLA